MKAIPKKKKSNESVNTINIIQDSFNSGKLHIIVYLYCLQVEVQRPEESSTPPAETTEEEPMETADPELSELNEPTEDADADRAEESKDGSGEEEPE